MFQRGCATDLCGCTFRSLNVEDPKGFPGPTVLLKKCLKPTYSQLTLLAEVRPDPAGIKILVLHGNLTVNDNDRNTGPLCLLQYIFPAGFHNRGQNDIVHFLLNEIPDSQQLILLPLLGVIKQQFKAVFFRKGCCHGTGVGQPPVRFGAELRKTDPNQSCLHGRSFAAGSQNGQRHQKHHRQEEVNYSRFFHVSASIR